MKNTKNLSLGILIIMVSRLTASQTPFHLSYENQTPKTISTNTIQAATWQLQNTFPEGTSHFTISHLGSDGYLYRYQPAIDSLSIFNPDATLNGQYNISNSPPLADFVVINRKLIYNSFGIYGYDPQTQLRTLLSYSGGYSHCINPVLPIPGRDISQIGSSTMIVTCTVSVSGTQFYCNVSIFDVTAKVFQTILKIPCELTCHSHLGAVVAGADGEIYAEYSGPTGTIPELPNLPYSGLQRAILLYRYDLQTQQWSISATQYPINLHGNFGDTSLIYIDSYSSLYYLATVPDAPANKGIPRFTVIVVSALGSVSVFTANDLNNADTLADVTPDGQLILIKTLSDNSEKPSIQYNIYSPSFTLTPIPT